MKSGINKSDFDTNTRPQDDFFQFVNGPWLKKNPIPASESRWGTFYVLRDESLKALRGILESLPESEPVSGSNAQKLHDFYISATDETRLKHEGFLPLKKELEKIQGLKTKQEISRLLSDFHIKGISSFFAPDVDSDLKRSDISALYLMQGGLGLPDRDYYFKDDEISKEIRRKYLKYLSKLFELINYAGDVSAAADIVVEIETRLASASLTRTELRDLEKQYNKMSFNDLVSAAPDFDWKEYFDAAGIGVPEYFIVCHPPFLKEIDAILKSRSIEDVKIYLTLRLIDEAAPFLSDDFVKAEFDFHKKTIAGMTEQKPRWKRAVMVMDALAGEILGELYVKKYFNENTKEKINELVNHVTSAFGKRIKRLDWMTDATKQKALSKLAAIRRKLGYPDVWRDYSALEIKSDSYLQNVFSARAFETKRQIAKIGKPTDRTEWHTTPQTVNAYCSFLLNEIVFPAGILQPPFFDPEAFEALNYGAIGSFIGHELTHAFDDQGSKFDKDGDMNEWWREEDRKKFSEKAQVLKLQFDELIAVDDVHVNGALTLGENIADLGGLAIAYDAFKEAISSKDVPKKIDGFGPDELFFIGFAISERGHARPEEARRAAATDPHSPHRYRVNVPLSNFEPFALAFDLKEKDGLYRPPEARVKIW